MKLLTSSLLIVFCTLSIVSCQKEHTCECYSPSLNRSIEFDIKDNKKDAEAYCKAQPVTGQYTGTDFECFLK